MHETNFRIRSTQVDVFGHLNNAAYLEIYEWARWEWAEEMLPAMEKKKMGPAILHIDLSFTSEIRMHEEITVRTRFESVKNNRGIIQQEMVKSDGKVASTVKIDFVMFNLEKRRIVSMPAEMIKLLNADISI